LTVLLVGAKKKPALNPPLGKKKRPNPSALGGRGLDSSHEIECKAREKKNGKKSFHMAKEEN